MRVIALIILIFGAALAGGAVFFASEQYAEIEKRLREQAASATPVVAIETTPIVVAAKRMEYGAMVVDDQLKVVNFPKEAAPANAFTSIEEVMGDRTKPRSVLRTIEENEPILNSKVSKFGQRATISTTLTQGMRAFTLKVDTVSGVAGFLLPNDRVDVFLTSGARGALSTEVILQNVKVIAADQFAKQESNRARVARTITVEVTPDDAARLALAQQVGRISLSLRQIDEDATDRETKPVKLEDVVTIEKAAPAPEPAPAPKQICVRRGNELVCN